MPHEIIIQLGKVIELLNALVQLTEEKPVPLMVPVAAPKPENDKMLTRKETASLFSVSNRTISRWQQSRFIEAIYIGGNIYFSKIEVEQCAKMNKLNKK